MVIFPDQKYFLNSQIKASTPSYTPKILINWVLQHGMDKICSMLGTWLNFHLNSNIQPSDLLLLF